MEALSLPDPQPGLVIRYSYLWRRELLEGREEGVKHRPCAIVVTTVIDDGRHKVYVLPVTHSPPRGADSAIEIPMRVKESLGLDADQSWIVTDEYNVFTWPGPDLHPLSGRKDATVAYGLLPPRFTAKIRAAFQKIVRAQKAFGVPRSE